MKNYRTYKGDVTIELSRDFKKTITIIHGEMGRGKTTILGAIYWCLYGESRSTNTGSDEIIINNDVLDGLKIGDSNETLVELYLYEQNELRYKIKRSVKFIKKQESATLTSDSSLGGRISGGIELTKNMSFSYRRPDSSDSDGWGIIEDPNSMDRMVDNLFPKSLSKYFLFDAELLDSFFDTHDEKNIKVKDGIEKISGLPILEDSITHLKNTSEHIAKNKRDINTDAINEEISMLETGIAEKEKIINEQDKKIENIQKQIDSIDLYLRTYNEETINTTQKQIEGLIKDIKENNDLKRKHTSSMNDWLIRSNILIRLKESMEKSMEKCNKWEREGKIPIAVSGLALKNILRSNPPTCICGAGLAEGSTGRNHIEELLQNLIESPMIQNITIGRGQWDSMTDEISQMSDNLKDFKENRDKLNTYGNDKSEAKKKLEEKFEKVDLDDVQYNFKRKKELHNDKDDCLEIRTSAKRDKEVNELMLEKKQRERKFLIRKDDKRKSDSNKMLLADTMKAIFVACKNELVDELRETVAKKSTEYFLRLVSKKQDFSNVEIQKNYKTIVLDNNRKSKDLSAGQNCCLALSFIAAIRDIAEKNYFMIIDSPLHNISQEERVDIAENLPAFLPETQITLLVQDQEYTGSANRKIIGESIPSVRETMMKNNTVWKEYVLETNKSEGTSYTTVKEIQG